ncbi:MAG: UDP-glucose 4-epimerase GalE [Xanthobacteraceae bacterium]
MTVLVTGGAGYIGSHMVLALLDAGQEVLVLDDLSTGFRRAVPARVQLIEGDCGDEALVADVIRRFNVRAIIHFAGSIIVPESVANPLKYYLNNTVKSRGLIATAVAHGVSQFIFSSTAAVYGDPPESPIGEDAPLRPISPYGSSKLMTEVMLRDAGAAHGLRSVALRYFNVAGADPQARSGQSTPQATHLIKIASQAALGARPGMELYGIDYPTRDGTCIRDYIHVSDLAQAHLLALAYLEGGGASLVLNCGYGHGYTVREVIAAVKKVAGVDFQVKVAPRRPGDPAELVARAERIKATLDWKPRLDDLETIVAHALAWEAKANALSNG